MCFVMSTFCFLVSEKEERERGMTVRVRKVEELQKQKIQYLSIHECSIASYGVSRRHNL